MLADITKRGTRLDAVFTFAHCDVDINEAADKLASKAGDSDRTVPVDARSWWRDAARARYTKYPLDDPPVGAIRTKYGPKDADGRPVVRREKLHPEMSAKAQRILAQLRTGVCGKLGGVFHDMPQNCMICGVPALTRGGGAIEHLFSDTHAGEIWYLCSPACLWSRPHPAVRFAEKVMPSIRPP
jgi:hypothetical protein